MHPRNLHLKPQLCAAKDLVINAANAQTGNVFDQCIGALLSEFPQFSDYLDGWLRYKLKWAEYNFNMGVRSTQAVESMHASLKQRIRSHQVPLCMPVEAVLNKCQEHRISAERAIYRTIEKKARLPTILHALEGMLTMPAVKLLLREASCLMDAFRVASLADGKYKVVKLQDHFSVLLEQNGACLCSCAFFHQYRLPCRHTTMKVMLAIVSPATVHSVAARWLVRSPPQHPPRDLRTTKETEKDPSIVSSSLLSTAQCPDTEQLLGERLQQAVLLFNSAIYDHAEDGVTLALVEAAEQACDLLKSKLTRFQKSLLTLQQPICQWQEKRPKAQGIKVQIVWARAYQRASIASRPAMNENAATNTNAP